MSVFAQTAGSIRTGSNTSKDANKVSALQEAVMNEASLFRQYARDASRSSSKATSDNEKQP